MESRLRIPLFKGDTQWEEGYGGVDKKDAGSRLKLRVALGRVWGRWGWGTTVAQTCTPKWTSSIASDVLRGVRVSLPPGLYPKMDNVALL